jgi:hypothetical protein
MELSSPPQPKDRNGNTVQLGTRVRLVCLLLGDWLTNLPADEKPRIESMIGEIFAIEEIDEWGGAWISKSFEGESADTFYGHSIRLAPAEMENALG